MVRAIVNRLYAVMNYRLMIRAGLYIGTTLLVLLAAKVVFDGKQWQSVWGQYFMFYSSLTLAFSIGASLGILSLKGESTQSATQVAMIMIALFVSVLSALLLPPFFTAIVLTAGFIFSFIFQFRTDFITLLPDWYRALIVRLYPFVIGANAAIAITWF